MGLGIDAVVLHGKYLPLAPRHRLDFGLEEADQIAEAVVVVIAVSLAEAKGRSYGTRRRQGQGPRQGVLAPDIGEGTGKGAVQGTGTGAPLLSSGDDGSMQ